VARRYRIAVARRPFADLRALPGGRGAGLGRALIEVAAREPPAGLIAVSSRLDLAACEVSVRHRIVLVYAVIGRDELLAGLIGAELDRELRARAIRRVMHGRR
jgi:hypothetical protein